LTLDVIAVKIIYSFMIFYGTIFLIAVGLVVFINHLLRKVFSETAANITGISETAEQKKGN